MRRKILILCAAIAMLFMVAGCEMENGSNEEVSYNISIYNDNGDVIKSFENVTDCSYGYTYIHFTSDGIRYMYQNAIVELAKINR